MLSSKHQLAIVHHGFTVGFTTCSAPTILDGSLGRGSFHEQVVIALTMKSSNSVLLASSREKGNISIRAVRFRQFEVADH